MPQERGATSASYGNTFGVNVSRVQAKMKSQKKTRELLGSNPIAHTYVSPFKLPADGRMKSQAGCFGSSLMKDSMDVSF